MKTLFSAAATCAVLLAPHALGQAQPVAGSAPAPASAPARQQRPMLPPPPPIENAAVAVRDTARPAALPGTVIVPASAFLNELPKGDVMADARTLRTDWIFNNTAITLKSKTNLLSRVAIPEDGTYYVYVRSQTTDPKMTLAVSVNDRVTTTNFGGAAAGWQRGDAFELKAGMAFVKVTRIKEPLSFDVLVLSKNPNLRAEDIQPYQLDPNVKLLREYHIPNSGAVKFGDANGDGKTDLFVLEGDFSANMYDNGGKLLWRYQAPTEYRRERSEFEAPGVMWDFDGDGRAEVAHWRFIDGQEWLVMADGRTGAILHKTLWPTKPLPHVYNNFRLAIGKLRPGARPNELVVFSDFGGAMKVQAYDARLNLLWNHDRTRAKDNLGHYVYPIDLDGDGLDEVLVGSLLLDRNGKEIWNRFDFLPDNRDHADSYKFADLNGDGKLDIVSSNSETGVFAWDAMTGRTMWEGVAEHSQQLAIGRFLKGMAGLQVVVGGRTYALPGSGEPGLASQLYWFDGRDGTFLKKWPGTPLNGNPDFVRGNWRGDGSDDVFWFKFRLNDKGEGEFYFPDPVFHMFDFTGQGADEVITLANGSLKVFGYTDARHSGRDSKKDPNYLKNAVVNHTHY